MKKNRVAIVTIILVAAIITYQYLNRSSIEANGIYTIARVDRFESASDGVDLHISIFYNNKVYQRIIDTYCDCDGKFFFIKIEKDNPTGQAIFSKANPVPDCILRQPIPPNGWNAIPKCP